ncbi:hypothetical protein CHS0354_000789 [Potamilus streckersoni]|uniref:Lipoyl synthase, mitochondrial n=1 Tax=Potamilus streckersoni TaxID=2493646 RepID=A0AAE0T774_9BIVA|nr:hypothetical protein CHS0354_000789 [Potamilus streckersoni]
MGESVMEGTILKWHKKVGDKITKDENILDIATDKVDAEVPSQGDGVLLEILYKEGDVVEVGKVIATIETDPVSSSVHNTLANIPKPTDLKPAPSNSQESPASTQSSLQGGIFDIVMPKMGESIMEGTILRWHKKVGDKVKKDENILDIATDKVDAEVPSVAEGIVTELLYKEGDIVEVGKVIARVSASSEGSAFMEQMKHPSSSNAPSFDNISSNNEEKINNTSINHTMLSNSKRFLSPVVLNIAKAHKIPLQVLDTLTGTGIDGRLTKKDIETYLNSPTAKSTQIQSSNTTQVTQTFSPTGKTAYDPSQSQIVPMDNIRRAIAEHMIRSKHTSAHVTSVSEADVTGLASLISQKKNAFQQTHSVKLTFTPFFVHAVSQCLKNFSMINSSVEGTNIIYKKYINIGVAVALGEKGTGGLIVPVIKNADQLNIIQLSRSIQDLASRARDKKLFPEEMQGGTFTITNYGITGNLFGSPVINQPQLAILGTGAIVKRPVVITQPDKSDTIVVRHMMYLSLSYDHRVIDGAQAGYFLQDLVNILSKYDPDWLKVKIPQGEGYLTLKKKVDSLKLHTVCEEARCPNIADCWSSGVGTIMILGETCTRSCGFCAVKTGKPPVLDLNEPKRVAEMVKQMGLNYAVITSVNRDELEDGGASIWRQTIREIRNSHTCLIEVLIPDFQGLETAMDTVFSEKPDVLNHNIETVPKLYKIVRPQAKYERSLHLLKRAKEQFSLTTKSGIMVGLGETKDEVIEVMHDLSRHQCDILTVGQYLQPTKIHLPVRRYVPQEEFEYYSHYGRELGFKHIESGPLVRSSYHADKQAKAALTKL